MDRKIIARAFMPLLIIFIVSTVIIIAAPSLEFLWGMTKSVMLVGNSILFVATMSSLYLYLQSFQSKNAQASLRMIYGGIFAKMMICLFTVLIYIMIAEKSVSKGGILGCMFLYFLYTFVEVSIILKLSRKAQSDLKKNNNS